jgi:hypothetical protein
LLNLALDTALAICSNQKNLPLMKQIPKTELSPDNGCIIDTKWKLGPLSYHASAAGKVKVEPSKEIIRLPELVVYDHIGFGGAYARTNLSFHYIGDFWNDRISCLIVVSGVWRFYRDEYYKGDHWDLGPGFYESFFAEKGQLFQSNRTDLNFTPRICLSGARESRAGCPESVRATIFSELTTTQGQNLVQTKFAMAGRHRQHASRVRYPDKPARSKTFLAQPQESVKPEPPWP